MGGQFHPETLALMHALRARRSMVSAEELQHALPDMTRTRISERLSKLMERGWAERSMPLGGVWRWRLKPEGARLLDKLSGRQPAGLVPPPQYDCMHGPTYTPEPAPPTRAGADQHLQIKSRGLRC